MGDVLKNAPSYFCSLPILTDVLSFTNCKLYFSFALFFFSETLIQPYTYSSGKLQWAQQQRDNILTVLNFPIR